MNKKKILLISKRAWYLPHIEAFKYICKEYDLDGFVATIAKNKIAPIHQKNGQGTFDSSRVWIIPEKFILIKVIWFVKLFKSIKPDFIWVQEEPNDMNLLITLGLNFFNHHPRIISAVCENIFSPPSFFMKVIYRLLWPRLNGVAAVAKSSIEGLYKIGFPKAVPYLTLVSGCVPPSRKIPTVISPFSKTKNAFVIGFVGRLTKGKGWYYLLSALSILPNRHKLLMFSEGEDLAEFDAKVKTLGLSDRVVRMNFVAKDVLWSYYKLMNCLVLPSIDTPRWKEQFGGVLGDAMAMKIPIVASDSGGIKEVVGPAGIIVPQKDSRALSLAIKKISSRPDSAKELAQIGYQRFFNEFEIKSYAKKIAILLKIVPV